MSESQYREMFRTGLAPFVEDVSPGPDWDDLTSGVTPVAVSPRGRRAPGWMVGLGVAVVVLALFGLAVVWSPSSPSSSTAPVGTGPESTVEFDGEAAASDVEAWWLLVISGDVESAVEMSHPDVVQFNYQGFADLIAGLGDDVTPAAEPKSDIGGGQPAVCYTLTGSEGHSSGEVIFAEHDGSWLIQDIRSPTGECSAPTTTTTQGQVESLQWSERESWPLERRSDFSQVWTGSELIVWGGLREDTPISFANGARYSLERDQWTALAAGPLAPRSEPVAVWTGEEVIYWGGYSGDGDEPQTIVPLTDGAAYDPATDAWRPISPGPLDGAHPYSGAWTGDDVVVIGPGESDAAAYDPILDSWTPLPTRPQLNIGAPLWISVFWTGDEIVVAYSDTTQTDVLVYTPDEMTWRVMPPSPFTSMDLPVSAGSAVQALSGNTLWLLGFAPSASGLAGVDIDSEDWVVSQPLPAGDNCSSTQSLLATAEGLMVESCGVAKILDSDGTWEDFPNLPRTLPKIPGPQPILTGQSLVLLEAGIEPGATNFPDGADPHLWVLDER